MRNDVLTFVNEYANILALAWDRASQEKTKASLLRLLWAVFVVSGECERTRLFYSVSFEAA